MTKDILKKIKKYKTIIIHRHHKPDFDAYGSQMGLKAILKENFKDKEIYVVGDDNAYPFDNTMDNVSDEKYKEALVFILDTSVEMMVYDARYKFAHELIVIDHHKNETDLNPDLFYKNDQVLSCSELIFDLAYDNNLKITDEAANHLFAGIIGDSGRFQYIDNNNGSHVFFVASKLMNYNVDVRKLYDFMQLESLSKRKAKLLFREFELTENNVAYRINNQALIKKSGLDFFSVSRGMVNLMAGITEVTIWANVTQNELGEYVAELRSRKQVIVDIAKKYGGGGHDLACGATLKTLDEVYSMIKDLNERANEK